MESEQFDLCVIGGAGHVGLPLSIAFASAGKRVVIQDINASSLALIESGSMPFMEKDAEPRLKSVIGRTLFTSTALTVISQAHFVVVIIGTPVDKHLNPTFDDSKRFFNEILPHLRNGQILILRSTLYPGLTAKIQRLIQAQWPQIEVCFCPERIAEGKAMEELHSLPQIVSGFNLEAIVQVRNLFQCLTSEIIETTPIEAELAKLFTNSWRYIQFATANQFYMIAEEYGVDFYRIYEAMTQHYPRIQGFPKPGWVRTLLAEKIPMQLSAFANNNFFLGHSAMLINEGLPNFVVNKLKKKLDLNEKVIGILGMAFKAESDDSRESLSYKLRKILLIEAKGVLCSDPYIQHRDFISEDELISRADVILIGAPHRRYQDLNFQGKWVIDIWNYLTKKDLK